MNIHYGQHNREREFPTIYARDMRLMRYIYMGSVRMSCQALSKYTILMSQDLSSRKIFRKEKNQDGVKTMMRCCMMSAMSIQTNLSS